MARIDTITKNARIPKDNYIVRVAKENIEKVLDIETTACITSPQNLSTYKNIIILCDKIVVAVAAIKCVRNFDAAEFKSVWNTSNKNWRSTIEFGETIKIGDTIERVFSPGSHISSTQTVNFLKTDAEVSSLIFAATALYSVHINSFLSDLDLID